MAAKHAEPIPQSQHISFRIPSVTVAEYIPRMEKPNVDDFKLRLRIRIAELGISANAASLKSALSRETVRKILRPEAGLPETETIEKLAFGLDTTRDFLLYGRKEDAPVAESFDLQYADGDVEIKGVAAGSYEGAFQILDSSIGRTPLPRGLKKHNDVYAIIIINDSMTPEHKPGEVRFATPSVRPKIGDSVVIEFERDPDIGPQAMIGHLLKNGQTIKIGKLNPIGQVEIDSHEIRRLDRIAPYSEILG
jgi:hypothetical protein